MKTDRTSPHDHTTRAAAERSKAGEPERAREPFAASLARELMPRQRAEAEPRPCLRPDASRWAAAKPEVTSTGARRPTAPSELERALVDVAVALAEDGGGQTGRSLSDAVRAGCEAAAPEPTPSTGEEPSPSVSQSASPGAEAPVEERIEEGASPRDQGDQDRGHEPEDPPQPRGVEQLATTSLALEPPAPASDARESQGVAPPSPSSGLPRSEPSDVRWTLLRDVDGDRARVEFEHPELGAIRLELSLGDAGVDVEVLAPALWSAVAIKRSEQELRETLRAHGVRLAGLRIAREDDSADEEAVLRPLRGVLSTEA